eukprot:scaffold223949_cov43-Prasinocladus_malaysianus.AAC.1
MSTRFHVRINVNQKILALVAAMCHLHRLHRKSVPSCIIRSLVWLKLIESYHSVWSNYLPATSSTFMLKTQQVILCVMWLRVSHRPPVLRRANSPGDCQPA